MFDFAPDAENTSQIILDICQFCTRYVGHTALLSIINYIAWSLLYQMSSLRGRLNRINPLKAELNPICHLLALLGAHHILHVSRIRVKQLCLQEQELSLVIFIHSAVQLSTGPQPLPRLGLHRTRSSVSSFNFQDLLISLRPPSSCLRLLPRPPFTPSFPLSFL